MKTRSGRQQPRDARRPKRPNVRLLGYADAPVQPAPQQQTTGVLAGLDSQERSVRKRTAAATDTHERQHKRSRDVHSAATTPRVSQAANLCVVTQPALRRVRQLPVRLRQAEGSTQLSIVPRDQLYQLRQSVQDSTRLRPAACSHGLQPHCASRTLRPCRKPSEKGKQLQLQGPQGKEQHARLWPTHSLRSGANRRTEQADECHGFGKPVTSMQPVPQLQLPTISSRIWQGRPAAALGRALVQPRSVRPHRISSKPVGSHLHLLHAHQDRRKALLGRHSIRLLPAPEAVSTLLPAKMQLRRRPMRKTVSDGYESPTASALACRSPARRRTLTAKRSMAPPPMPSVQRRRLFEHSKPAAAAPPSQHLNAPPAAAAVPATASAAASSKTDEPDVVSCQQVKMEMLDRKAETAAPLPESFSDSESEPDVCTSLASPTRMVSPIWHGPVPIIEPSLAVSRTPQRACRKRLPARLRRIEASAQQDELDLDYSSSDESMETEPGEARAFGMDMAAFHRELGEAVVSRRPALWRHMQQIVLQATAAQALHALKEPAAALPGCADDAISSAATSACGISYVVPSCSRQNGRSLPVLPHTVIRPACPCAKPSALQERLLACFKNEATLASGMPWRDDNLNKDYLLRPGLRTAILQQSGGHVSMVEGINASQHLVGDRLFSCLHYHLDAIGNLQPCSSSPASHPDGAIPGIEDSNLQIVLLTRKGIGGTCPARAAGRQLRSQGTLSVLLDPQPSWLPASAAAAPAAPQPGMHPVTETVASPVPIPALPAAGCVAAPASVQASAQAGPPPVMVAHTGALQPAPPQPAGGPSAAAAMQGAEFAPAAGIAAVLTGNSPQPLASGTQLHAAADHAQLLAGGNACGQPAAARWTAQLGSQPLVQMKPAHGPSSSLPVITLAASKPVMVHAAGSPQAVSAWPSAAPASSRACMPSGILPVGICPSGFANSLSAQAPIARQLQFSVPGQHAPAGSAVMHPATVPGLLSPTTMPAQQPGSTSAHSPAVAVSRACPCPVLSTASICAPSTVPAASRAASENCSLAHTAHMAGQPGAVQMPPCIPAAQVNLQPSTYQPAVGAHTGSTLQPPSQATMRTTALDSVQARQPAMQPHISIAPPSAPAMTPKPAQDEVTGHARLRLHTQCCRFEMFLSRELWLSLSREMQAELMAVMHRLAADMSACFAAWNHDRLLDYTRYLADGIGADLLHTTLARKILPDPELESMPYVCVSLSIAEDESVQVRLAIEGKGLLGVHTASTARRRACDSAAGISEGGVNERHVIAEVCRQLVDAVCSSEQGAEDRPPPASPASRPGIVQGKAFSMALAQAAVATVAADKRALLPPFPWPLYLIGTRDSFTHELVTCCSKVESAGKLYNKIEYFFHKHAAPGNYRQVVKASPLHSGNGTGLLAQEHSDIDLLPVGITTYTEVLSKQQLQDLEERVNGLEDKVRSGALPPQCFHTSLGRGGLPKRTKFFFGARYLWTHEQLNGGAGKVARGVRVDVPRPAAWMQEEAEAPLVESGLMPPGFANSWAINVYHDGSEGIQSHFDDPGRFLQPITSLRLFSDCRLSFGTQLYGYTNGAFSVDMPRGCVTVMHEGGYAANGLKHCVRPMDMTGKSASIIMRKIQPVAMEAATALHMEETVGWLQNLDLAAEPRWLQPMALPLPGPSALQQQQAERIKRQCWKVLDACIRQLERSNKHKPPQAIKLPVKERRQHSEVELVVKGLVWEVAFHAMCDSIAAHQAVAGCVNALAAPQNPSRETPAEEQAAVRQVWQVGHDAASSVHTPQQQQAAQWSSLRGAATGVAQAAASSGTALHRQRRDWPLAVVPALSAAKVQSLLLELQGSLRPAEHATPTLQPAGQLPALHTHPCAIRPAAPVATQPRLAVQLQPLQAVPFRLPSPAPSTGLPIGAEWPSAVSIDSSALLPSRQQPATGESQLSSVLLSYLHQLALDHPAARQAAATNVTALPQDARRHLTYQPAPRMQLQQLLSTLLGASQRPAATPKRKLARSQPAVSSALACWQPELDQFAPPSLSRQPAAPGQHVAGHSAEIMPASTSGRPASASTCGLIMASAEHSDMKRPRVSMANLPAAVCHVCEGSIADAHGANSLAWTCTGPCRRTFHHSCTRSSPGPQTVPLQCSACKTDSHTCQLCGGPASPDSLLLKCCMRQCGRYFHSQCARACPLTHLLGPASVASSLVGAFRCPVHYCARCGASGDSVAMMQCIRCPVGYHMRCRPVVHSTSLTRKLMLCPRHQPSST